MKEKYLIKEARKLVDITIKKHKQKLLGNETMSTFMKNNIKKNITEENYNKILHLYSKYLSKEGYEIKRDTTKFDIITYN